MGKRLREIRQDSGLTARQVASESGWHESKCSHIEKTGRPPPTAARGDPFEHLRSGCTWVQFR
nr:MULTISPECIES: helix-turn-helix transcriptional regulator [unclassified Streptomyces]